MKEHGTYTRYNFSIRIQYDKWNDEWVTVAKSYNYGIQEHKHIHNVVHIYEHTYLRNRTWWAVWTVHFPTWIELIVSTYRSVRTAAKCTFSFLRILVEQENITYANVVSAFASTELNKSHHRTNILPIGMKWTNE